MLRTKIDEFKSRVFPNTGHMMEFLCLAPAVRCFSITEVDCSTCRVRKKYINSEEKTTQEGE